MALISNLASKVGGAMTKKTSAKKTSSSNKATPPIVSTANVLKNLQPTAAAKATKSNPSSSTNKTTSSGTKTNGATTATQITNSPEVNGANTSSNDTVLPQLTAAQLVSIPEAAPTMEEYMKSGFYNSANISALQELLAAYNQSDDQIRGDAEALYKPAFEQQKTALNNQLAELGTARDRDVQKLNSQYDRTLNSIMAGLNKQGMGRSSMVATRGVETENARNAAVSDVSYNYLQQQNQINSNLQQAEAEYAQNVENKAAEIKEKNRSQQIAMQAQISQLQQSGYSSYVNYIQNNISQEIQNQQIAIQNQIAQIQNKSIGIQNESTKLQNEYLQYLNNYLKK